MRIGEQTSIEQVMVLIRKLPLEDFDKLREIVEKEINNRLNEAEDEINPVRALEVLWLFHDDIFNEEKDSFSINELRSALRWILTKYEEQKAREG
jgi:hypothetical protein